MPFATVTVKYLTLRNLAARWPMVSMVGSIRHPVEQGSA
jgi:hypothetical protein